MKVVWVTVAFLLLALEVYSPAMHGPFLFDDLGLPFYSRAFAEQPLASWLAGVRPMLMLSYWANFQLSEYSTLSYHLFNVVLHAVNAILAFLLLRGLGVRDIPAILGAALFLLHPLQTESVAYIAGRSEVLCAFFVLCALLLFLRRPSWWPAIVVLYVLAVLAKEQAVVLPAAFVVIDLCIPTRSLIVNKKLYAALAAGALVGVLLVWQVLTGSRTAGFAVEGLSPQSYFWTQTRVWYLYAALFAAPFRLNADYDLAAAHGPFDYAAVFALAGLIAAMVWAWRARRRHPLVACGLFLFAIFLLPTSSIVPIQDLAAERRMYLPILGLVIALSSIPIRPAVISGFAAVLLIFGVLTYQRSQLWGNDVRFWSDVVAKSPSKQRGYTHLMFAYIRSGRCGDALWELENFPARARHSPEFLGAWGAALECANRPDAAIDQYRRAALLAPGVGTYMKLAMAYFRTGLPEEGELLADQALRMQPRSPFDRSTLDFYHRMFSRSRRQ